jgi:SAM-dependent methyltransferase/uncharacterized protein YbaR (Trm112 family)
LCGVLLRFLKPVALQVVSMRYLANDTIMTMDRELLEEIVCPQHRISLRERAGWLNCEVGHRYPVIEGIPVLLDQRPQTIEITNRSLEEANQAAESGGTDIYHLATLGISPEKNLYLQELLNESRGPVDPVVSFLVGATNGNMYKHLIGKLEGYPIPNLRLPLGEGSIMLDIGCNWGRWCVAGARLGYKVIGIDPCLGAVLAAKRVTTQLGLNVRFIVGDARFLPFPTDSIDVAFSYSVIQHFAAEDARVALRDVGRVLRPSGRSCIQMPTKFGIRCLYQQARRRFRKPTDFDVRYWTIPALRRLFGEAIGPTSLSVDCFFGIGLQPSDMHLMPSTYRAVIRISEALRSASRFVPALVYWADSVYLNSTKSVAH